MKFVYITLISFFLIIPVAAQKNKKDIPLPSIDSKYLTGFTWRNLGPFRGGRSCAVTGVPGKSNLYYFGATGGGVWQTTDAGNTWSNISDGFFGGSIGAIAVSSSDNNVIYVGQGEETVRGNVSSGFGVWKTLNAGKTWESVGLEKTRHISRIRIHPTNPDIVYVAAMGDLFKDSEERGVYKSIDGGKNWKRVLFADAGSGAIDLTFDPSNPRVLYASTWTFRRTPYSFSSGGAGSKLWKSTDNGETWNEISKNQGFPKGLLGIIGVTVSPANPNRVWAMVENEPDGGLYRSDDNGETWKKMNNERDMRQRAWYYTRIYADTKDADKVYVLNVSYFSSIDGGKTFKKYNAPHGDHHDLWIAPEDSNRMIIGDDGGAQITFDEGENWTTYHNQPTAQFYRVTTDNQFPFRIYGAQQDNSSVRINYRSDGAYITENDWEETAGGEAGHHAIYPKNEEIVLGGEYGGFMGRINHETNEVQATNVWPNNPLGHGVEDMKYRFQWNYPLFFSKHNPEKLYAFSNNVHVSTDLGKTWTTISPDLTTNDLSKQGPSGGPITKDNTAVEYYCTIFAAAESVKNENILWTGSDDGFIQITKNAGQSWENVTPKDLPKFTQINSLEADPFNEGGLYVAATRYKWGENEPYLFHTVDYGKNWKRIDSGIDKMHFTRVIRAVPDLKGLLFAGTEYGLYISFNDGASWQSFQNKLPIVPITDMAVKEHALIVATQGRSFWALDDLKPLYELEKSFGKNSFLFEPKPTYLLDAGNGKKSKTQGENHPNGAIINYFIKEVDTNQVYTLEIKDLNGLVIRSFNNKAKDKKDKWEPKSGINQFIWNLRTEGVKEMKDMILWGSIEQGPFVLPGNYRVYSNFNGENQDVSLNILKDPRIAASQEDLKAQFDFVTLGVNKMNEINKNILEIRKVNKQLEELRTKIENEVLKNEIDSLVSISTDIEKALYQTQNRSSQDPLNFPIRLNNKYGHVISLATVGFNRPTASMIGVKEELEILINIEIEKWQKTKIALEELNKKIRNAEIPFITW
jgi:photosystem II stability/assembly factor-like uncharacterized protein